MSKKRAKQQREIGPARKAFVAEMGACCCCGGKPSCVHEIFGGALRAITVADRRAWLAVCWDCHLYVLQDMPKESQLKLKSVTDDRFFDLDWINDLASNGRGGKRFSMAAIRKAQ